MSTPAARFDLQTSAYARRYAAELEVAERETTADYLNVTADVAQASREIRTVVPNRRDWRRNQRRGARLRRS